MGIITDAELRKGKAELARALVAKGVAAQPYEKLGALAAKVAGVSGGGSGGTPEKFAGAVLVPPLPGLSVATLLTPPPVTWNPSDNFQMDLSAGNLIATGTAAISVVRATKGHSSGKKYFEFSIPSYTGYPYVGFMLGTTNITNNWYNGVAQNASADGFAWKVTANAYRYRNSESFGETPPSLSGAQSVAGVLGLGYDFETKTVTSFLNGAVVGSPYVTEIPEGLLYPACSIGQSPWTPITAVFANVQYLPDGYSAWDS